MKPLDVFLRDHVRAPLKEKGFSRKGRNFRLTTPVGDEALISFSSRRLDFYEVEFIVDAGVLVIPHVEWQNDTIGGGGSSVASALWWTRLKSPFAYQTARFTPVNTWVLNLDDNERISFFLNELASLAERLRFLVDRRNLISVVRDPATEVQRLRPSREHAVALLLVDEGPSRELEEVLRRLESRDPKDDVASWIRARLASRSG